MTSPGRPGARVDADVGTPERLRRIVKALDELEKEVCTLVDQIEQVQDTRTRAVVAEEAVRAIAKHGALVATEHGAQKMTESLVAHLDPKLVPTMKQYGIISTTVSIIGSLAVIHEEMRLAQLKREHARAIQKELDFITTRMIQMIVEVRTGLLDTAAEQEAVGQALANLEAEEAEIGRLRQEIEERVKRWREER